MHGARLAHTGAVMVGSRLLAVGVLWLDGCFQGMAKCRVMYSRHTSFQYSGICYNTALSHRIWYGGSCKLSQHLLLDTDLLRSCCHPASESVDESWSTEVSLTLQVLQPLLFFGAHRRVYGFFFSVMFPPSVKLKLSGCSV
jgi:hypothetical protein